MEWHKIIVFCPIWAIMPLHARHWHSISKVSLLIDFDHNVPSHDPHTGVISHGRNFTIYRTFHNVINNANMQIHCFLLSLERVYIQKTNLGQPFPSTVYYQIDGGSENTARCVYAMCELLVAKRLCKRIVVTRLPVVRRTDYAF